MNYKFSRTAQLVGEENINKLSNYKIIIFGVGGVGGQALESLVRAGFTSFFIVDNDVVEASNINRQIIASTSVLGKPKVEVAKNMMVDINPDVEIETYFGAVNEQNINQFNLANYDFIIDAIDSFDDKIALIVYCLEKELPLISSMGAGNRFDPSLVRVTKIEKTAGCPLAKKVRYELRKRELKGLTVVTSSELPNTNNGIKPGSTPFVPPVFGITIARYIFTKLIGK